MNSLKAASKVLMVKEVMYATIACFFIVLAGASFAVAYEVIGLVRQANVQVATLPDKVLGKVDDAIYVTNRQMTGLQLQVAGLRKDINGHLSVTNQIAATGVLALNDRFKDTNMVMAVNMAQMNKTFEYVALPLGNTLSRIDQAAPDFLDCDHNANCVFNRYVGVSTHFENSLKVFDQHFPAFSSSMTDVSKNMATITGDVAKITTNITKPKPWYSKAWDIFYTGTNIARTLGK